MHQSVMEYAIGDARIKYVTLKEASVTVWLGMQEPHATWFALVTAKLLVVLKEIIHALEVVNQVI